VVILYLLKDTGQMQEAFDDYNRNATSGADWVMASWLDHKLLHPSAKIEDKDLRTPGAETIKQAVLEKLTAQ